MKRTTGNCSIGLLILVLTAGAAWAQATAQLSGRVTDESGAVLPGVTVTATQTDTGFTRTSVTDGTGVYVMTNLPTGPYRLEVSLQGFTTYVQTGIVLQVGATPTINATLGLGGLEESVTVEAAAPLVDVQSAGIGEVVEQERIVQLPLQGRNVTNLVLLAGAAVQTGGDGRRDMPGSAAIGVAGGLPTSVGFFLDGALHNDPYNNLNLPLPFPDALQEFRVATSGLSADNGVHSGASVTAVTKSGTNRFAGNAFEFLRDSQFNAKQAFAAIGPDGQKLSDGLNRHQLGGTLGGPIVSDRFFFFGAFQGTKIRETPPSFRARIPTAAMLAGDFTTFASTACQPRQATLRAPFVNNRVDPARLSPAAVKIAAQLPATDDPCGEITYAAPLDTNAWQAVSRFDYQLTSDHSLFGRYLHNYQNDLPTWTGTGNPLTTAITGRDRITKVRALALGDTQVFGSSAVNSFRATWNQTYNALKTEPFFGADTLGIKSYTYVPASMVMTITGGFNVGQGAAMNALFDTDTVQVSDEISLVRARHQLTLGGNLANWHSYQQIYARGVGNWVFNGSRTGLGLADFLTGQLQHLEQDSGAILDMHQWYLGLYAQDAWRMSSRMTLNVGLRWEPYFGQQIDIGQSAVSIFSRENFRRNVTSTVFTGAPAGLYYPGDPGFPAGTSGHEKQWLNFSPRLGIAWDVRGDGRLAVRSSYALAYSFPTGQYQFISAAAAPFGNRVRVEAPYFDDPWADVPGGDPHPSSRPPASNAPYPSYGAFGNIDPDINSPRTQSWNVTVERQLASEWAVEANYIGSHSDRLWGQSAQNPGVFLGLDPCVLGGVSYRVCTTTGNLNQRRALSLSGENPEAAKLLGPIDVFTSNGTQDYHGLKIGARRRAATGVSLSGNYTWSYCEGNEVPLGFLQISAGYHKPDDPSYDRGNCVHSRRHIGNVSMAIQTPSFGRAALRAVASDWRVTGIVTARSGNWLTVIAGQDVDGSGIANQRVNQVLDDPYGDGTLGTYLNAAAFERPAPGTLGDHQQGSIAGPGFWQVDLALSRLISFGSTRSLELRAEVFNLFNNFNWGDPNVNFNAGTFGQIRAQAGDPRIMQFGVKYGF
jgi:hypothetical protein